MSDHRRSYRKTLGLAVVALLGAAGACAGLLVIALRGAAWPAWIWVLWVVALLVPVLPLGLLLLVISGGLIALRRDTLETQGRPYPPRGRREWLPGPSVQLVRRMLRGVRSLRQGVTARLDLRPGELVQVKSLEEIVRTLDDRGTLDAMPFTPEMVAFCGRTVRVFRRVEKLNDWVHKTGLHRVRDTVLLDDLRCDGSAHSGCQANCHLRWKEAWLRRPSSAGAPPPEAIAAGALREADLHRLTRKTDEAGSERYVCQATELTAGTPALGWGDPRHYLRDLLTGNVRLGPFLTGVSLALFNAVQRKRGGAWFPAYTARAPKTTPQGVLNLRAGELVRVKAKEEIELTLDQESRNRGLRFDVEMLRFCGGEYRVQARIDRLILERAGRLLQVKNPCIILEGVMATGEYNGFNPENESIFWREVWLDRVVPGAPG
jgi:hypothetical protein